jgi:hypothetical protein
MYIDAQTIIIIVLVAFITGFAFGVMLARPKYYR